jgi:hypothetical protein
MSLLNRIACTFCAWRVRRNEALAEKHYERACTWSERHLHFAVKHLLVGAPNTKDVSDPPFLPIEQRAREAGV